MKASSVLGIVGRARSRTFGRNESDSRSQLAEPSVSGKSGTLVEECEQNDQDAIEKAEEGESVHPLSQWGLDPIPEVFRYGRTMDVEYYDNAPDSDVSIVKVAKEFLSGIGLPQGGIELTNLNLPACILDPASALEKSMKAMKRGELLVEIAESIEKDPLSRFLSVTRFVLSGYPKEKFGKKPYNPVLGEVFRAVFVHRNPAHGHTVLFAEQVSHKPVVSAIYWENRALGFSMTSTAKIQPKFWGNSVEVKIGGNAVLKVERLDEDYIITRPIISQSGFLGVGRPRVEFVGEATITCPKTNLQLILDFKQKTLLQGFRGESSGGNMTGRLVKLDSGDLVAEIAGAVDDIVRLRFANKPNWEPTALYDSGFETKQSIVRATLPLEKDLEPTNSLAVWGKCSKAIWNGNGKQASEEKRAVEEFQREVRRRREEAGVQWSPKYFDSLSDGESYMFRRQILENSRVEIS